MESRAEMERDYFAAEYRQSTTACCPRQTIPDSCSCIEGCSCLCRDCDCGEDEWDDTYDGNDFVWGGNG